MTVIHVDFGGRGASSGPQVISDESPGPDEYPGPDELLGTFWRHVTWMYWNASRAAMASYRRGSPDNTAVLSLRDIHLCPPSHRLKCAAGGTLVTIRAEHMVDGWGASA